MTNRLLLAALVLTSLAFPGSAAQTEEYQRARQLLTEGHAAEAAAIFRKLAQADKTNADVILDLTIALYKASDFRGASESAGEVIKLKPDMLPAYLFLGASHLELGEYAEAIAALERVVVGDPNERNGRLMLGKALLAEGKAASAVEQFEIAAQMIPANPGAWYALARGRELLGQKEAALGAYEHLAALPASAESHRHAAEVHDSEQRWREAALEWQHALLLTPDDQSIRLGLAGSLFHSRDYTGAIAMLKPLLQDRTAGVQFLYGASLMNMQQPEEAVPYLREALSRNQHLLPACAALGQALLQTGKPEEAIPLLIEGLSLDEDGSLHFQLFRAYQLTHRVEETRQALADYQRLRRASQVR